MKAAMKAFGLFLLSTCAAQTQAPIQETGMPLAGSEWATKTQGQYLQFMAAGKAAGNGGCNQFGGTYMQNGKRIKIGPLRSTKMACANLPEETVFFNALNSARFADVSHLKLILKNEKGELLLTLNRRDWD